MKNGLITDTVLNSLEGVVAGTGSVAFANLMYIINLPLAFLIPSSSAHATLAMPILAPLADFAKLPRSIVVTSYQSASGLLNLITPTSVMIRLATPAHSDSGNHALTQLWRFRVRSKVMNGEGGAHLRDCWRCAWLKRMSICDSSLHADQVIHFSRKVK